MTALDIVIANRAERYGLDPARVAQMYRELARGGRAVDHFVHLGDTLLHAIAEHSHDMMHECVLAELGDPRDKAAWLAEFLTQHESPFFRRLNPDGTMGEIAHEDGEYIAAAWAPVANIERAIVALDLAPDIRYDPSQPRDDHGKWTDGASEDSAGSAEKPQSAGTGIAGNDIASLPGAYGRRSPSDAEKRRDVAAVWSLDAEGKAAAERAGISPVEFEELTSHGNTRFHSAISAAKQADKYGAAVHVYEPGDYAGMRTFVTPDGKAGFAIKDDDLVSLFKHPDATAKGFGHSALALGIAEGARRLDAFDTVLPFIYSKNGFRSVARIPWNDTYKPSGWNYDTFKAFHGGRPDVVFMVHDPVGAKLYEPGDGPRVADYDAGNAAQHAALGKAKAWDESKHPRDPAGSSTGGQFTGGDGDEGDREHPGEGYSKDAWVDAKGAIHTSNVKDAQRALFENRKVVLKQPKQVSTLIHELAKTINRYRESGETAPLLDLCNVSVEGTNLFCAETKGIPRVEMPQMDTKTTKRFVEYLKDKGYEVDKRRELASHLRATQNQLSAEKVVVNLERHKDEPERLEKRLVVSRDNYILDGHHHWAAKLALDAEDNKLHDDTKMRVSRVDIDIITLLDEAEKFTGGKGKKPATEAAKALREWDESKHPRDPAGTSTGGQFTSGGGGEGEAKPEGEAKLDPNVINVGGDEWNQAVARKLERDYQDARPSVDKLATDAPGKTGPAAVVATGEPDEDEGEPPYEPDEWGALSGSGQEQAFEKWKEQNQQSFYDSEVDNWSSEQAPDDARRDVAFVFNDDKDDEKNQWAMDALNDMEQRFPFGNREILDAITIEGMDNGYGGGSYWKKHFKLDFDDEKLNAAGKAHREGEGEELPMGQGPPDYSKLLTEEMRADITEAMMEAFDERADKVVQDMEPPDYLNESVDEYLDQFWDEKSDNEKFEWTKQNTDIVEEESTEGTGSYAESGKPKVELLKTVEVPNEYDPLNETDGTDYRRTQAMARYLSVERAYQVLQARKIAPDTPTEASRQILMEDLARIDGKLWAAWKSSSTSPDGKLLQQVTAEELGGRLNTRTGSTSGEETITPETGRDYANRIYKSIGGYDGVKAYVRAKWEVTQYLLDKAGINELQLYRGIKLSNEKLDPAREATQKIEVGGEQYLHLPTLHVDRNGAASTSTDNKVASDWDGDTNRVVLRASVPRTAAVSVPAYGINVHSEHEVVIAGTAWKAWDAWQGRAPTFEQVPMGANGTGIGDNAPLIKQAA